MKYFSGVIFDFNGTLFWDTSLHNTAWDIFLEKYGYTMTDDDKFRKMHGKNNRDILIEIFGNLSEDKIERYIYEKETLYQDICRESGLQLAPGAKEFLDFLNRNQIACTIATASDKINVDFYFDYLNLTPWFVPDKIIYNDGSFAGKPAPDIYIKAMSLIDKQASEVVVFEDAYNGIEAAHAANAGQVVIVNSTGTSYNGWDYSIIENFDEVNRTLLFGVT